MKTQPTQLERSPACRGLRRSFGVVALGCGLYLSASCRQQPPVARVHWLDSNEIASVQGSVIPCAAYRQKLASTGRGDVDPSSPVKEAVLEELICHEAVYAQALAAKFDQRPEIVARIKALVIHRFIEEQLGSVDEEATRAEIQEYYARHRDAFVTPAVARGALITLRASGRMTPGKREELKERAAQIRTEAQQAKSETDFARVVQQHSEHQATRYHGGDLGWLTRAQGEAAFGVAVATALFALEQPEQFAPLLETPEGFQILKLRERKEAQPRPLAEVESLIVYQLRRQRQFRREAEFYARMKQGLDIQINRPLLESISIPPLDLHPPGLPGPGATTKIANR